MKDSQPDTDIPQLATKYIKESNERFSTEVRSQAWNK